MEVIQGLEQELYRGHVDKVHLSAANNFLNQVHGLMDVRIRNGGMDLTVVPI